MAAKKKITVLEPTDPDALTSASMCPSNAPGANVGNAAGAEPPPR